ncbi:NCS1 family nucleobase:cation symporter-1 [Nocardioides mangrovi]|uniref:NCS1 family nucleobase:cation symporter-1 n=1 Tax=Nocardioides mangrovi TaxID=2874580 RepID=A0ABS7UGB3_9ACTN|nr:NCS1 family nucleobase:cation symporter-1 [Nocardioides mangrovi]MBZ5740066.1 NCS1 family nucleobase:cation symporter-1 [Nocardioides mangrovi]
MTDTTSSHRPEPDLVEAAGYPPGRGVAKRDYHPRLTNEDLAPLKEQTWGTYNIFAFWMSDVHSVGGYLTAGSLFALGLTSWQVFICLIVGICIVQFFCNLVAKPSQLAGVPYPVISRASFGVLGANIPAIIRGLIAVAWYGVQTFLAAESLNIVFLKIWPGLAPWADVDQHGFLGLSVLGYVSYAILWVLQGLLFWRGMDTIRKFIDFAGPAVYVAMMALCIYLLVKADFDIDLNLSDHALHGSALISTMLASIAVVVSYFSGPMLNFGDFSRYSRSFDSVKKGNFWGLPINFVVFSLLTVLTAAATVPVYGELITDPIQTVNKIDNTFAIILGGLTFVTATVGINIVANFISPAFDFSHVNPQKISWRAGGMIAAVGSVLLTPWNWYDNPDAIFWTLGLLGALIGPLFGILIADFYLVRHQKVVVDDLFTMDEDGTYYYRKGYNMAAVQAVVVTGVIALASVIVPKEAGILDWLPKYSWFVGCGLGFGVYLVLARWAGLGEPAEAVAGPVTAGDKESVCSEAAINLVPAGVREEATGGVGGAAEHG